MNVWKIAPGEKGCVWTECRDDGCITINWLNEWNLSEFESKQDLRNVLLKTSKGGPGVGGAPSIWHFVHNVKVGDVVVANHGLSRVLGIGLVTSEYLYPDNSANPRKSADYHRHTRRVEWLVTDPAVLPKQFFNQPTVQHLTPSQSLRIKRRYLKTFPGLKKQLDKLFPPGLSLFEELDDAPPTDDEADDSYIRPDSDRRELVWQQIRERRGQRPFRDALRRRYGNRCVVTGCTAVAVLEAAHIDPYRGVETNKAANGLLLRADIHTLFDLHLLGIDPTTLHIEIHPEIAKEYPALNRKKLTGVQVGQLSTDALKRRYEQFQKRTKRRA